MALTKGAAPKLRPRRFQECIRACTLDTRVDARHATRVMPYARPGAAFACPHRDPPRGLRRARVARRLPGHGRAARVLRSGGAGRSAHPRPRSGAPATGRAGRGPVGGGRNRPVIRTPARQQPPAAPTDPRPLDLNRATVDELARLPGVGQSLARRILEERERRGRFDSPDALRYVMGIGPKKLAVIRELVGGRIVDQRARPSCRWPRRWRSGSRSRRGSPWRRSPCSLRAPRCGARRRRARRPPRTPGGARAARWHRLIGALAKTRPSSRPDHLARRLFRRA